MHTTPGMRTRTIDWLESNVREAFYRVLHNAFASMKFESGQQKAFIRVNITSAYSLDVILILESAINEMDLRHW